MTIDFEVLRAEGLPFTRVVALHLPLLDVAEAAELVRLHFPMSRESWGPRERALAGALATLAEAVEREKA